MSTLFGDRPYSDEALWHARYKAAADDVKFWRNFCWLKPFAVSTSTRTVWTRPVPPRPSAVPAHVEVLIPIPQQRSRTSAEDEERLFGPKPERKVLPSTAALTEQAIRNSNRGGRA